MPKTTKLTKVFNRKYKQFKTNQAKRAELAQSTYEKKRKATKAKQEAKRQKRLNPNTAAGRQAIITDEKHQKKVAEIQAKKKLAEKTPEFAQKQLENKLEIAKIAQQGTSGAAKASAIAAGAAEMTKAVRQENDDDDEKERQQATIEALIYGGNRVDTSLGDNGGLSEGVY